MGPFNIDLHSLRLHLRDNVSTRYIYLIKMFCKRSKCVSTQVMHARTGTRWVGNNSCIGKKRDVCKVKVKNEEERDNGGKRGRKHDG